MSMATALSFDRGKKHQNQVDWCTFERNSAKTGNFKHKSAVKNPCFKK